MMTRRLGGLTFVSCIGALAVFTPAEVFASPPPYLEQAGASFIPLFVAAGLLALLGIAIGLLRGRQRPGPGFLIGAITGSALLATWAVVLDPIIDTRYWGTFLEVEATLLAAAALAAWVWGKGRERHVWRRFGGILLVVTVVASAGLWAIALSRAARAPYHVTDRVPAACGRPVGWSPPEDLVKGRWIDYRAARRPAAAGEGDEMIVGSSLGNGVDVDLLVFHDAPGGAVLASEKRIQLEGEWGGITADPQGRLYAASLRENRHTIEVAQLRPDFGIASKRRWLAPPTPEQPQLTAGTRTCVTYPFWDEDGGHFRILQLDARLRPIDRAGAVLTQIGAGKALSGWVAMAASLACVAAALIRRRKMQRFARRESWEGRVLPDGTTLETADGTLVRLEPPPTVPPGETCCAIGRRATDPAGGPYREAVVVVRADRVLPGTWADAVDQTRDHQHRIELLTAATIALLTVSAVDLLLSSWANGIW